MSDVIGTGMDHVSWVATAPHSTLRAFAYEVCRRLEYGQGAVLRLDYGAACEPSAFAVISTQQP